MDLHQSKSIDKKSKGIKIDVQGALKLHFKRIWLIVQVDLRDISRLKIYASWGVERSFIEKKFVAQEDLIEIIWGFEFWKFKG